MPVSVSPQRLAGGVEGGAQRSVPNGTGRRSVHVEIRKNGLRLAPGKERRCLVRASEVDNKLFVLVPLPLFLEKARPETTGAGHQVPGSRSQARSEALVIHLGPFTSLGCTRSPRASLSDPDPMKLKLHAALLLALTPLLGATAAPNDSCSGCEDLSTTLNSNGPYAFPSYGGQGGNTVTVTTTRTASNGICAMRALDPPNSHIQTCQQALPCLPRITITISASLPNFDFGSSVEYKVTKGQICTAKLVGEGSLENGDSKLLFDQTVRVPCGTSDCPVDIRIDLLPVYGGCFLEGGVDCWEFFELFARTATIGGALVCTPCGVGSSQPGGGF